MLHRRTLVILCVPPRCLVAWVREKCTVELMVSLAELGIVSCAGHRLLLLEVDRCCAVFFFLLFPLCGFLTWD